MRNRAAGALVAALATLVCAAPAAAARHAVIAFLPAGPGETRPLLDELAARGMAIAMTSPSVGGFSAKQMALDMTQGSRIPLRLYSGPTGSLVLRGGRLTGWDEALRRAARAPGDVKPGLLAASVGRTGYRGPARSVAAIVAADRAGRVARARPGDLLDVVELAPGAPGLRQLDGLLRQGGLVYVVRAPSGTKLRLLPSGLAAPGVRGKLRSDTTRRDGLISATDVAPTVLRFLGLGVPSDMQGQVIEARGTGDPAAVAQDAQRLAVVTSRRGTAVAWLVAAWAVLLAGAAVARRGLRAAVRTGLLAALWVPGLALVTAALRPGAMVEGAIIGVGAVALGFATERAVRWPLSPAIPAAVVFLAHAVDLARGSPLIGASIAGPNPAGGARFFGIGNELEVILSVSVLIGTGAALTARADWAQRAPAVFAAAALVAAVVMGAGRLGADVGAVITLGAGGAAAVIASLPNRPSRRALALAVAAPVAAVGALIALDLILGGGAHLTRSVVHAHGTGDLGDIVRRRFSTSLSGLGHPARAILLALALVAVVWLAARGRRVLARAPRTFAAGLIGAWFATVVGAVANDSGPLILEIGTVLLLLGYAFVRAQPRPVVSPLR